jgi:hypothetical protein
MSVPFLDRVNPNDTLSKPEIEHIGIAVTL